MPNYACDCEECRYGGNDYYDDDDYCDDDYYSGRYPEEPMGEPIFTCSFCKDGNKYLNTETEAFMCACNAAAYTIANPGSEFLPPIDPASLDALAALRNAISTATANLTTAFV